LVTGAFCDPVVVGAVVFGEVAVGAASSGTAGADVGGGATFAGCVLNPFSSTERGADV
jgi:hypothetical protein